MARSPWPDRRPRSRSRDWRRGRRDPYPAPPPWQDPYARRQPGAAQLAAGSVLAAGRAVHGYGRWVARSPDTRGLGTALAALYPAGEAVHAAAADPLLVGAFAPPAALAAYVATYKAHRSRRYSATIAATAAGVPAWLAVAAATGITDLPVLLGYSTAAAASWSAITWSDVMKHRKALQAQRARWDAIASAAGLENSRLIREEETRTGQRFTVDIRATGKTARQLARRELAERIAAVLSLPAERVRVATDPKHAGNIIITVQTTDPWAAPVTHPALDPGHAPARRSVMVRPDPARRGPRHRRRARADRLRRPGRLAHLHRRRHRRRQDHAVQQHRRGRHRPRRHAGLGHRPAQGHHPVLLGRRAGRPRRARPRRHAPNTARRWPSWNGARSWSSSAPRPAADATTSPPPATRPCSSCSTRATPCWEPTPRSPTRPASRSPRSCAAAGPPGSAWPTPGSAAWCSTPAARTPTPTPGTRSCCASTSPVR